MNLENIFQKKNYDCNYNANNTRNVTINIIYEIIGIKMLWVSNNMNKYCAQINYTDINKTVILTYSDCCNNNMKLTMKNLISIILVIMAIPRSVWTHIYTHTLKGVMNYCNVTKYISSDIAIRCFLLDNG